MLRKGLFGTAAEVAAIVVVAATVGIAWNHQLLASAWRGEAIPQAPARSAAPAGTQEELPLPLGLMQVKDMHDAGEALLVDARDAESYAAGHLKGALSLPLGEAQRHAAAFQARVPKERSLIVYCNGFSCHDSMTLGKLLIGWGYRTVYVFEGGYPEWHDAGYPVQKGKDK